MGIYENGDLRRAVEDVLKRKFPIRNEKEMEDIVSVIRMMSSRYDRLIPYHAIDKLDDFFQNYLESKNCDENSVDWGQVLYEFEIKVYFDYMYPQGVEVNPEVREYHRNLMLNNFNSYDMRSTREIFPGGYTEDEIDDAVENLKLCYADLRSRWYVIKMHPEFFNEAGMRRPESDEAKRLQCLAEVEYLKKHIEQMDMALINIQKSEQSADLTESERMIIAMSMVKQEVERNGEPQQSDDYIRTQIEKYCRLREERENLETFLAEHANGQENTNDLGE